MNKGSNQVIAFFILHPDFSHFLHPKTYSLSDYLTLCIIHAWLVGRLRNFHPAGRMFLGKINKSMWHPLFSRALLKETYFRDPALVMSPSQPTGGDAFKICPCVRPSTRQENWEGIRKGISGLSVRERRMERKSSFGNCFLTLLSGQHAIMSFSLAILWARLLINRPALLLTSRSGN